MVFRAVEGSVLNQGSVSGTDTTPFGMVEDTRAVRIFIDNPAAILGTGAEQTVINTTASGTGVTIQGAGSVFVNTVGKTITVSGGLPESGVSEAELVTVSGHLQTQIDGIDVDELEDALVGVDGITIISGTNIITVSGFQTEFVSASGSLQSQIDSIDVDEVEPAIVGGANITVTSGSSTTTVALDDTVTVSSVSGTLDGTFGSAGTEDAGVLVNGVLYESALKASDIGGVRRALFQIHRHSTTLPPVFVSSRSNTDDDTHAVVASGQDLLSIIGTGWSGNHYDVGARMNFRVDGTPSTTSMPGKIEFRTNPPGSDNLNPTLVATMFSDQSTDFNGNPITNVGDLNANTGVFSESVTVSGIPVSLVSPDITSAEVVTISGHLQTQIDSFEAVDAANALVGTDGITVISGSNVTTVSGFRTEFVSASGSLQSQINDIDLQEAYDNGTFAGDIWALSDVTVSGALSANSTTDPFLPPRMTNGQKDAVGSPSTGSMIFNTTSGTVNVYDGSSWRELAYV